MRDSLYRQIHLFMAAAALAHVACNGGASEPSRPPAPQPAPAKAPQATASPAEAKTVADRGTTRSFAADHAAANDQATQAAAAAGWQAAAPAKSTADPAGAASDPGRAATAGPQPLTPAEQARYDRVARQLVEAINAQDKDVYRALHTDAAWESAIDWWRDMFAGQVKRCGKIERAYAPQRDMVRAGNYGMNADMRNGASFVAIFEDDIGGVFSFELNDANKIVHTSVFIQRELANFDGSKLTPIYELGK